MEILCLTATETVRLIRDGQRPGVGGGGRGYRGGGRGRLCPGLSLHCHNQNDFCIKMGSDASHFNVSLIVRDKVTRQCPQTITFLTRRESRSSIEPRSFCLPALCLTARPKQLKTDWSFWIRIYTLEGGIIIGHFHNGTGRAQGIIKLVLQNE